MENMFYSIEFRVKEEIGKDVVCCSRKFEMHRRVTE